MHRSLAGYLAHVESGYIRMVEWDELVLFNYTDQCTFDRRWDEFTLKARGIIYCRHSGDVVAHPFGKFFNYEEHEGLYGREAVQALLRGPHYVQEKMDGSLGIIYWWKGQWRVATRGSFSSDQALRATEILKKYDLSGLPTDCTCLAEIIYPENRIIVPYGEEEKLVLLAVRHRGGHYCTHEDAERFAAAAKMPVVAKREISVEKALELKKSLPYTEEGWVVVCEDGTRLKIKGDDYMRIAKFKANLGPLAVWEALSLGSYQEMAVASPEECRAELGAIYAKLSADFGALLARVEREIELIGQAVGWDNPVRKTIALEVQRRPPWMHGPLFSRLTSKEVNHGLLWKLLRPAGNVYVNP
jgi:RNA ligase